MAYDRYDRDQNRDRDTRDQRSERGWRGDDSRHDQRPHGGRSGDDRGFFERAGDEIASWFGGSDQDRDHGRDQDRGNWRSSPQSTNRDYDRGYGRDYDRDRSSSSYDSREHRSDRHANEDRGLFNRGGSSDRDYDRSWSRSLWGGGDHRSDRDMRERDRSGGDYRPMTGDYGRGDHRRSDRFAGNSGSGRGQPSFGQYGSDDNRRMRDFHRESDRSEGPWSRDDYRRTSFAGSLKDDRDYDPNYRDWRERHMSEVDRDYDDYRREHQSRFEDDFGGWRDERQEKRGMLGRVREHMDVVGKDGEHVGTVDKVAGDRIILTKSDAASGGAHHSLGCSAIDRVEGNRVVLDCSAKDARNRWRDEDRSRALFERHDQGQEGPGALNRSFSGTYRDR